MASAQRAYRIPESLPALIPIQLGPQHFEAPPRRHCGMRRGAGRRCPRAAQQTAAAQALPASLMRQLRQTHCTASRVRHACVLNSRSAETQIRILGRQTHLGPFCWPPPAFPFVPCFRNAPHKSPIRRVHVSGTSNGMRHQSGVSTRNPQNNSLVH